jgi:hypothetical protein
MSKLTAKQIEDIKNADELAILLLQNFEDCDDFKRTAAFMEAVKLAFKHRTELIQHIEALEEDEEVITQWYESIVND